MYIHTYMGVWVCENVFDTFFIVVQDHTHTHTHTPKKKNCHIQDRRCLKIASQKKAQEKHSRKHTHTQKQTLTKKKHTHHCHIVVVVQDRRCLIVASVIEPSLYV
jgi:hypothetical protein